MERRDFLRKAVGVSLVATCPFSISKKILAQGISYHPARWWQPLGKKEVICNLCPRRCVVGDNQRGYCEVRENKRGKYYTLVHSWVCALNNDPIEKKPLFHYHPGTMAYSLATAGCNLDCKFCQNWHISQFRPEEVRSRYIPPLKIVTQALSLKSKTIAFTYSEPVIFSEYVYDISKIARRRGIGRVIISNGYIMQQPLKDLCEVLDGVKIDLKSFSNSFYQDYCRAQLKPVTETLKFLKKRGIWFEIVVLLIPTLNDSKKEIQKMSRWILTNLGPNVPVHFTRFHPTYKLRNLPPTPVKTMERARNIALKQGLKFVYLGNVPGHPGENTYCPRTKKLLIRRLGFHVVENRLRKGRCPCCKKEVPGIWG
jgi:pyruvate formate lyase activating enzyme